MQEIWKDILHYEGLYQVSSKGEIRSLDHEVRCKGDYFRTVKGCTRKPQITKRGYRITGLCDGIGGTKTVTVHQLVAQAFIPNFVKGTEINHIDGNPGNNCIENLEVSNPSHNQFHAVKTGLRKLRGTSVYHNVSYIKNPKAKSKWAACINHNGSGCYGWKTFMTEIGAARYVDQLLDSIHDTDRLRNFS